MKDLHCHLLPGVDDGAERLDDALAMARVAVAEGIQEIVATPHAHLVPGDDPRAEVGRRVAELQAALDAAGIPLVVRPGSEVYLEPDTPQRWDAGLLVPLANSSVLLVETSFHEYPYYVPEVIFQLQARGARILLAHPERYVAFQRDLSPLEELAARGVVAQVTAGSLLGVFGKAAKQTAEAMLQRGLAHILATDAHRPEGNRAPTVQAALARAAALVGEARAQAMVEVAPRALLAGEPLELPPVVAPSNGWAFWKRWAVGVGR
jgi:protein-tyrosine phosphatase